ncbi:spore maturation protein [Ammoniphilus resinae]|uniref:Spore maturation protein B n=1 Tax=Ammoniphilus resinae TaxID=861532 RepID=A0ABS4GTA6_9BACL|nr:nucleoside recognition domain-containing protein [Ammoniphilus resinae]MBP1933513.1 spore maturation protein B [Ammoniphilus resinae]
MYGVISSASIWAIPLLLSIILVYGMYKKVPVFEVFAEGAKGGFDTAIKIIPHLVGMLVAVSIFRQSGALEWLTTIIQPVLTFLHIPGDIIPLALLRPITGAGSLAVTTDIIANFGPDSFLGRLASTMQGSTDTTLYVLTVYFGAVGIRNSLYALKVGLLADLVGIIASLFIVTVIFT